MTEGEGKHKTSFSKLGICSWLTDQLQILGLSTPTDVQMSCIPAILSGQDCIGAAKTGSGKTLAFVLPILQALSRDPYGVFALVLTPTRELAFQISEQFKVLGSSMHVRQTLIVGGVDRTAQTLELNQRPHIIVATPGRLFDHLSTSNMASSLSRLRYLVLDEADRLLDGKFNQQLSVMFSSIPERRQTLLFSATITPSLHKISTLSKQQPHVYEAPDNSVSTVSELEQRYVMVPRDVKDGYLVHVVHQFVTQNQSKSVVIFTDTCKGCQILVMMFQSLGFQCLGLHSMLSQKERITALTRFKSSLVRLLIATDVASRGLDIPTVDLVVNHNVPSEPKDYVHRVGRTARAGRNGLALTFITQSDIHRLHAVEDLINVKLQQHQVNDKDVLKILSQVLVAYRDSELQLNESNFDERREINKRKRLIMEGKDPEEEGKKKQRKGRKKASAHPVQEKSKSTS